MLLVTMADCTCTCACTAGASLVQLYTAMAYDGPALVPRMKRELAECLARDGFSSVAEAVGADHKSSATNPYTGIQAPAPVPAAKKGWLW